MGATTRLLTVGDVTLTIDLSLGARATRWTVGDLSLLTGNGDGPVESGMYPMAPWAGRLRDNTVVVGGRTVVLPATRDEWALHGTVLAAPVELIEFEQAADRARLAARVVDHVGWPWPTQVDVTWDLRPRELVTTITVTALEQGFPVVVGWHPWFARHLDRGGPVRWDMNASAQAERGSDYLPTGALLPYDRDAGPFDDAFVVPDGRATVTWPGALSIEILADSHWYVVYDQLAVAACVEPQTGPPDGLNQGLGSAIPTVEPGRPHRLTTRWLMRDDPPADRA